MRIRFPSKEVTAISCLFLIVGAVLLTNEWAETLSWRDSQHIDKHVQDIRNWKWNTTP